jgi:CelD/BcsL family acetyltransferase involved in cellulose biosynthesis
MTDFLISAETNLAACFDEIEALCSFEHDATLAFQNPKLLQVWLETIGRSRSVQPYIVRIAKKGRGPVAFLPLGIHNHGHCRVLSFLDGGVSDYNVPIPASKFDQREEFSMDEIWPSIVSILPRFDVAVLQKVPKRINAFPNFLTNTRVHAHISNGHLAVLSGSWDQYIRGRPKTQFGQAATRRRLRRRLEERGSLHFAVATSREQCDVFFWAMVRQKRRKLLETRGFDSMARFGLLDFYRCVNEKMAGSRFLHVSALLLDDVVLATHWGYVTRDRFYYLLPGYEGGEWTRYGAGHILTEHLLKWSFANGIRIFDFGIGDEPYKAHWCDETVELVDFNCALTLRGKAYLATTEAQRTLKQSEGLRHIVRLLRKQIRASWTLPYE